MEAKKLHWESDSARELDGYGCMYLEATEHSLALNLSADFDRVTAERDALQQRLNTVEEENDRLRTQLARMIGQAENMLEIAENCSDPDEDDDGNFDECREYIKSAENALENRS